MGANKKFSTNTARVENRLELNSVLQSQIGQLEGEELMEKIHQLKIPAGIIQNVQEALEMKEAQELLIDNGNLKGVLNFAGKSSLGLLARNRKLSEPPHLGQHTLEVISELKR
jgi:crotonobetainyl-CoA:carnitine CoA-transferase CaiB-like acyl-CoA transferase